MILSQAASAPSTGTPLWATILIGILAACLGAGISGLFKAFTESKSRRAESQVQALYALQVSADRYRRVLIEIGDDAFMPLDKVKAYDSADSELGIYVDRVRSETVRSACERWRTDADLRWRGAEEVTPARELAGWGGLREAVNAELRRYDA